MKKTWKLIVSIFAVLAGVIAYLFSKNKDLLVKVIQADASKEDAVLETKKEALARDDAKLKQAQADLKKIADSSKKSLSSKDAEKFWNEGGDE